MDENKMQEVFKKYDTNRNSFLELSELNNLLHDLAKNEGFPIPDDSEISQIFKDFDLNNDGYISFVEFKEMFMVLSEMKS